MGSQHWLEVQRRLRAMGYGLGSTGPAGDGVDGNPGDLTAAAVLAELMKGQGTIKTMTLAATVIALIDAPLLHVACPERSLAELQPWVEPLRKACVRFEINTVRRVAAFIAQIAHEGGFQARSENLNYSVEGLLKTFGRDRISEADCRRYGRSEHPADQRAIANCVYGGEWGRTNLGNTAPDDGWEFRGVGPLQVTGRANMTRFAAAMGMTIVDASAYAETIEGGVMAAAWFWEANDINRLADTPGVADETRKINGGEVGLADRTTRFNATVQALLERGA